MENNMSSGILLTINLPGQLSGFQKHVEKQIISVDVSPIGAKFPNFISKKITHNDRIPTICSRKVRISEETVHSWEISECPYWEKPSQWKSMTKQQRIDSNIKRYDEGFGVSYDFITN